MHAACAFTTLLLGSIFSNSLEHPRTENFEGRECRSPVCQMRADLIKTSIDNTVDPCNDFFMFTCGNWIKAQPPMKNGPLGHIFNYQKEHILLVKKAFISGTYNTEIQQAVDKVQMAFQACMKDNASMEQTVEGLKDLIQRAGVRLWPVWLETLPMPQFSYLAAQLVLRMGTDVIFKVGIASGKLPDPNQRYISVSQASTFLARISKVSVMDMDRTRFGVQAAIHYFRPELNTDNVNTIMDEIFKFESELTVIFREHEKVKTKRKGTFKTIDELQSEIPEVDWHALLKNLFQPVGLALKDDEMVYVMKPAQLKKVSRLLHSTKRSIVQNYMIWFALYNVGCEGSKKMSGMNSLCSFVRGGPIDFTDEGYCISKIDKLAHQAVQRITIQGEVARLRYEQITFDNLVNIIKSQFHRTITQADWIDNATRRKALNKLKIIKYYFGLNEVILNDTYLNDLYKYVKPIAPERPFLDFYVGLLINNCLRNLELLREPYNRTYQFSLGLLDYGVMNFKAHNVYIGDIMLRTPHYAYGLPEYINLASLGNTLAHELAHAFGLSGSRFDEDGSRTNWWSKDSWRNYTNRFKCFMDRYNKIVDNATGIQLNASNNAEELMADIIGVSEIYKAYKWEKEKNSSWTRPLKGLSGLSDDKLFFISMAMPDCSSFDLSSRRSFIVTSTHPILDHRLNFMLSSLPQFSAAFKCAKGSPMNPSKECILW